MDGCSVHALVKYCGDGDTINTYCDAVLEYYEDTGKGLAMMALMAVNDDWSHWCSVETMDSLKRKRP